MKSMGIFLSVFVVTTTDAAKILAYIPTPSISHQVVFRPLTQELARRGHEVVVITTDPAFPKGKTQPNLTEIDIHDMSYETSKEAILSIAKGKDGFSSQMDITFHILLNAFDKQMETAEVKEIVFGDQSFDLLILEACMPQTLALSHVFKAPVILVSSLGPLFGTKEIIGAPSHPILYPKPFRQRLKNLTFPEKFYELYSYFKLSYKLHTFQTVENEVLQKHFGKNIPPISELKNNVDMLFLNIHPIFEGNHPVPPSVIYVWGIHQKQKKELPQEMKSYLDSSKNGVIYMSFGTNTDPTRLPPEMIQAIVKVFCDLPYDVLWKWDADDLPGRCRNIRIGKWFPQSDLLRHPKIKLFVTQGGLQSTNEALIAGVPLLGIPMIADQWFNVEKYVEFNIGVHLEATRITEESFRNAVLTIINDESYRRNVGKLNSLLNDDPLPPLERAVWWTEYVIRHKGAKHLRAPAANISWAQYLELEFVSIISIVLCIVIILALLILQRLYCFTFRKKHKPDKLKVK